MRNLNNNFLFSEAYIKESIKNNKKIKGCNYINMFTAIKEWHEPFEDGDYSEDEWIDEFIDLSLDVLGFKKKVNFSERVLYTNSITDSENPVATCYVLEKNEDLDCKIKGNYYSYKSVNLAKKNNVEWAMLTNGYIWRIYNVDSISCYDDFLELNIEESIKNKSEPDDIFKLFILFFSATTYYKGENGELEIENIKSISNKTAENIEEFLRNKSEEILKDLCYGLKENMNFDVYDERDKKNIYNDAVILLFRLLFIGYAESRKLLPCNEENIEYDKNSFFTICSDAKDILNSGKAADIKDGFEFWNRIDDHLRIYVDNTYDGGLFENIDKPILNRYKIANGYLIKCLAEMAYYKDKKTGLYKENIEYKDLSVRNLGSIYEGLLEYNLFIAKERMVMRKSKGKVTYIEAAKTKLKKSDEQNLIEVGGIYLSQDALERKDTGSYYTPEDVVDYIVKSTVGSKLGELKKDLNTLIKEKRELIKIEPTQSVKKSLQREIDDITIKFIEEKILKLSIIDSAMGSGHFLVNAAYCVANFIVEIINENDWINEDICTDISYWKRRVVENCIYGIDINKLAVYLARVSLWLISASNDKALSFIDHHLKEGNSIIGTTRECVEIKDNTTSTISLFDVDYTDTMNNILEKYKLINEISGNDIYEVHEQKRIYKEIEDELALLKIKYNYYLACQYNGEIENKDQYAMLMKSRDISDFSSEEVQRLLIIAEEKKFFHWELEYPEVILNGGFNIYVGNPPYVESSAEEYKNVVETKSCHNLYAYIIENTLNNLEKSNSKIGVILPSSSVSTPRMKEFQKFLINQSSNIYISTYDDRPGKLFTRLEHMRAAIIISDIGKNKGKTYIFTTKYNRWYSDERKNLFKNILYNQLEDYNYLDGYIPKFSYEIENNIIKKIIKKDCCIKNYVSSMNLNNNIYYGTGVQYWIKAMDKSATEIDNTGRKSSGEKMLTIKSKYKKQIFTSIINSSIFYWYFLSFSDCRNLTKNTIESFPFNYENMNIKQEELLVKLSDELMNDYIFNSNIKECTYVTTGTIRYREYYPKKSKRIIDKIDKVLGEYYGFSKEELEFLINYDIKFRMGRSEE